MQQFFRWYAVEEEVPNPMAGMSPPHVPEQPVPVPRKEQLAALLKCCSGKTFVDRRDLAILYMFMDARLSAARRPRCAACSAPLPRQLAYADLINWQVGVREFAAKSRVLARLCEAAGRDPASLRRTHAPNFQLFDSERDYAR